MAKGNKKRKEVKKKPKKDKEELKEKKSKRNEKHLHDEEEIDVTKEYPFALCSCITTLNIAAVKETLKRGQFFKCAVCMQENQSDKNNMNKKTKKQEFTEEKDDLIWLCTSSGSILCTNHAKTLPKLNTSIGICINTLKSHCFHCDCDVGYTTEKSKYHDKEFSKSTNEHAVLFKLFIKKLMQDVEKQKPSIYAHVEFIASINEAGAEKSVQRWSIDDGLLKAIHGLYNLGNTCFFNSVLQSLSHAKPLVTYFIDFDRVFPPEKKKTEPLAPTKKLFAGELTFSMQLHFNQYYSWQQNILNPKMLFHTVCKMAPQFKGYAQHDAQELLRYLQMNARDEFVRALKEKALTEGEKVNEYANIIDETFRSEICSTIICHNCKNVSRRYEDCYDISIPIPRILKQSKKGAEKCPTLQQRFGDLHARELATYRVNKEDLLNPNAIMEQVRFAKREEENDDEVTLLHCMWGFSACELLTEENGYQCDKCSHIEEELTGEKTDKKIVLRDATKQISMNMPAKNLTIHLKRFVHNNKLAKQDNSHKANLLNFLLETNGGIFQKDDTKVTFQTTLELGSFIHPSSHCHAIPQEKKNRYQLYAVIEHEGSMNAGHYTAYVRLLQVDKEGRSTRGDWYHISDSYVTKVTLNELLGCEPYILFYELME